MCVCVCVCVCEKQLINNDFGVPDLQQALLSILPYFSFLFYFPFSAYLDTPNILIFNFTLHIDFSPSFVIYQLNNLGKIPNVFKF